jgi:hypothetical protein
VHQRTAGTCLAATDNACKHMFLQHPLQLRAAAACQGSNCAGLLRAEDFDKSRCSHARGGCLASALKALAFAHGLQQCTQVEKRRVSKRLLASSSCTCVLVSLFVNKPLFVRTRVGSAMPFCIMPFWAPPPPAAVHARGSSAEQHHSCGTYFALCYHTGSGCEVLSIAFAACITMHHGCHPMSSDCRPPGIMRLSADMKGEVGAAIGAATGATRMGPSGPAALSSGSISPATDVQASISTSRRSVKWSTAPWELSSKPKSVG